VREAAVPAPQPDSTATSAMARTASSATAALSRSGRVALGSRCTLMRRHDCGFRFRGGYGILSEEGELCRQQP
jgi:hypothetical protein